MMKEFFKREPVKRAIRTFVQAAAGYIAVNVGAETFNTRSAILGFMAATVAAGMAAAMNLEEE